MTNLKVKLSESNEEIQSESKSKYIAYTSNINSITPVDVRPILVRDRFFQDVQYDGTGMTIELSIQEGIGLILVNTAIPRKVDFQSSAKISVRVA